MKKGLKYTLISLGSLVALAGIGLGIMYVVSPYKMKRWLGIASSYSDVFVDRLKGQPYFYHKTPLYNSIFYHKTLLYNSIF